MKKLWVLNTITYSALLLIITLLALDINLPDGVYQYTLLGAIYEMIWLPLLFVLGCVPIAYFILRMNKKISTNKIIIPIALSILVIIYLITQ